MAGPTVKVSIDDTDLNLAHDTATVTFTFSAPPPLGFTLDNTSAVGGTLSNLSQLNATTYTATFTAAASTDIGNASVWPAPGSEDTELGVLMELEVGHGETEVHAGVQA